VYFTRKYIFHTYIETSDRSRAGTNHPRTPQLGETRGYKGPMTGQKGSIGGERPKKAFNVGVNNGLYQKWVSKGVDRESKNVVTLGQAKVD